MSIRVGIAPDSWGVWMPSHSSQPPWWRCLDEMKISGYEGCEIGPWGYMPNKEPEVLKNAFDSRDLKLVGATVGGNYLDDESVSGMLDEINSISCLLKYFSDAKYIVLLPPMYTNLETGKLEMSKNLNDKEWRKYCENVERCSERCSKYGYEGLFHPHVDSHVQTEEEIDRFLKDTNVNLCFDTGHHVYGGGNPIEYYRKNKDRIPYIHIKDCDLDIKRKMDSEGWSFSKAVVEGIMVEPGNGSVDFREFYNVLKETDYDGWCVVEQDLFPVKSHDIPLKKAITGRENLRKAGFK